MAGGEFLLDLATQARRAVRPLEDALDSEDAFAAFLAGYGWVVDPASFDIAGVNSSFDVLADLEAVGGLVATTLMSEPDDIPAVRYADIASRTAAVVSKLRALSDRPVPTGLPPQLWATFTGELLEGLVGDYLETYHPALSTILTAIGVLEQEFVEVGGAAGRQDYQRRRIVWDRLAGALTGPFGYLAEVSAWDVAGEPVDHERLFGVLARVAALIGLRAGLHEPPAALLDAYYDPDSPHRTAVRELRLVLVDTGPATDRFAASLCVLPIPIGNPSAAPGGMVVTISAETVGEPPAVAVSPFTVGLLGAAAVDRAARLEIRPTGHRVVLTPPAGTVDAVVELSAEDRPVVILGSWYSHHLRVEGWTLRLRAVGPVQSPDIHVELAFNGVTLVLDSADFDDFLGELSGGRRPLVAFDASVMWSSKSGLRFGASGALELAVPINLELGTIRLSQLTVAIAGADAVTSVTAGVTGSAALGPLMIGLSNVGIELRLTPVSPGGPAGAFGALDLDLAFKPPDGLALALDAGPAQGGGVVRYDEANGRYGGALAIRFGKVAVQGLALLDTRLPGGERGFSLLVMLSARFSPGVQLGFGITLTGVGGLIGVNRRIDVDALRERFVAGTAANILTPPDSSRAIAAQLTDLAVVFPPAEGIIVIGPTVQLQWAGLVTVDAGIFVELPGPSKVVLLGTARAVIINPLARGPLLQLRADFVGVVDIDKRTIAFDAVLVDSYLLEIFAITGGMSLRADLGDNDPYLILTVGGFHPDFAPPRLAFPATLTRLAMSSGSPGDRLYLRFEGYFAITPNTMQFGAAVEVSAKLGPLRVKGVLGFDALVRFQPFYFTIDFRASLRVTVKGRNLVGVTVKGTISGPGPVVFSGKACISILFFDICGKATFELGSKAPPQVTPAPSAFEVLAAELHNPANVRAVGPDTQVVLRKQPAGADAVLPPTGLTWQQARAPLGLLLERFEGTPLRQGETVTVSSGHASGDEREWFAPGSFADLSDAEAVNRRTFERLPAGLRLATGDDAASAELVHQVMVEEIRIPAPPSPPDRRPGTTLPPWLLDSLAVRENRPGGLVAAPVFQVADESWQVRTRTGQVLAEAVGEAQAHQLARNSAHAVATVSGDTVVLANL